MARSRGLLTPTTAQMDWYGLSRRGLAADLAAHVADSRAVGVLRSTELDAQVMPTFRRGQYDQAVFAAFRVVEGRVRHHSQVAREVGVKLMRTSFGPGATLADPNLVPGERNARADLFFGAMGVHRNATGHELVDYTDPRRQPRLSCWRTTCCATSRAPWQRREARGGRELVGRASPEPMLDRGGEAFFPEPGVPDLEWGRYGDSESTTDWLDRSTLPTAHGIREFLNRSLLALGPVAGAKLAHLPARSSFRWVLFEMIVGRFLQILGATVGHQPLGVGGA